MNEIIERLKKEKNESRKEWFEIGKDKGLDFTKHAHYDEIQMVINSKDIIPMDKLIDFDQANDEWFEEMVFGMYPIMKNTEPWKIFMLGFIKNVQEFWDGIKAKV